MAFTSVQYQRISSEEDIADEDLPPTIVSTRANDERGLFKNFNSSKEELCVPCILSSILVQ